MMTPSKNETSLLPKRLELDPIGQLYASILTEKRPGNFYITAHLNEPLDAQILQKAVDDLIHRLPFLHGRLYSGLFCYYHKILKNRLPIIPADGLLFTNYYENGDGNVIRIGYGEKHVTVEAIHSIVDGRGLLKIVSALLIRYFELMGIKAEKNGIVDCADFFIPEEAEDAFIRFAESKKTMLPTKVGADLKHNHYKDESLPEYAYRREGVKKSFVRVISNTWKLDEIKKTARDYHATVGEYLLAHIFFVIAKERNRQGCQKPVTCMVPIDCRNFFLSQTFRNFVLSKTIVMPETNNFTKIVEHVRNQFKKIDKDFIQTSIRDIHEKRKNAAFIPRVIKKRIMEKNAQREEKGLTTVFSNLGRITLPKEVQERVKNMEFMVFSQEDMPYAFSCVTLGDALTLNVKLNMDDDTLVNQLIEQLC